MLEIALEVKPIFTTDEMYILSKKKTGDSGDIYFGSQRQRGSENVDTCGERARERMRYSRPRLLSEGTSSWRYSEEKKILHVYTRYNVARKSYAVD